MNCFIDTNIFLRVLVKDEEEQFNHCVEFLELVRKRKVKAFTSTLVLTEIAWTLLSFYEFPKSKVLQALDATLNLKNLKMVDDFDLQRALDLYRENKVKFVDSLLASLPEVEQGKMVMVSFDKDFDKLGVKRKEPQEIIS